MFTGLITHRARLIAKTSAADGGELITIANPFDSAEPISEGESIAVNGCCLTALAERNASPPEISFFVSQETLDLTTLSSLKTETALNLERAMRLGDRFGGHIVSGHIDCLGQIENIQPDSGSSRITVSYPRSYSALVIKKGSVTLDGVSLTINELLDEETKTARRSFTINIIPHTNEQTGFAQLTKGDSVNLEFDMLAKFAQRNEQIQRNEQVQNPENNHLHPDPQQEVSHNAKA